MRSVSDHSARVGGNFRRIAEAFLASSGLPFVELLSAERIQRVFAKHGNLFGGPVYSTEMVLWSFLSQVLRDGKAASCQAAVARIVTHQQQVGGVIPTNDTGDYCRARAKLAVEAVADLTIEVGDEVEQQVPAAWLWHGRHAKLADGFTFTMPDTPANQAEYPQPSSQQPGVGFPIARACALLSLATGCVLNLAVGPYTGKETGETALLREILTSLRAQDILVADRCYCSYLMIALLLQRQVDVCLRLHQGRPHDFRGDLRLGKNDKLVVWIKPPRPEWMDEATYATIPDQLELRMVRFQIAEPGRRTRQITVVTTLLDADEYSKESIAELYGFRWNSELDIRSIKQSLNLSHVRCKSPEMVRRELWTTLLGYNLIRTTAAAAAVLHKTLPRQISFSGTCNFVLAAWPRLCDPSVTAEKWKSHCLTLLARIARCQVAHRPGRYEPRQLKRRRHGYKLMQLPRDTLRRQLAKRK